MGWGDPVVEIFCDGKYKNGKPCIMNDYIGLTRTGRGWDDRNTEDEARALGWYITDDLQLCCDCAEERGLPHD